MSISNVIIDCYDMVVWHDNSTIARGCGGGIVKEKTGGFYGKAHN
jgi:hypothetical protein